MLIYAAGFIVGVLQAEDEDDDDLEFNIVGEIANNILELESIGPKSANIVLKSKLDREVSL